MEEDDDDDAIGSDFVERFELVLIGYVVCGPNSVKE